MNADKNEVLRSGGSSGVAAISTFMSHLTGEGALGKLAPPPGASKVVMARLAARTKPSSAIRRHQYGTQEQQDATPPVQQRPAR
jgi:hypothetical protein